MFSLWLASLGAGLLTLCILKWLGFSIIPTSAFVSVLLIGMPIGGFWAVQHWIDREEAPERLLGWMAATAVVGLTAFMALHRLNFMIPFVGFAARHSMLAFLLILAGMLVHAACFLPFFVAYGALEFHLFDRIQRKGWGRTHTAYGLFLLGLLAAYALMRQVLPLLGLMRMAGLGLMAFSVAMAMGFGGVLNRRRAIVMALPALLCLSVPGLDQSVAERLSDSPLDPTAAHPDRREVGPLFWTPYVHVRLALLPDRLYTAEYNGQWVWMYLPNALEEDPGLREWGSDLFLGKDVAVIGAGGGLQVDAARHFGAKKIWAVDLIGEIFDRLSQPPYAALNGNLYRDVGVIPVRMDGRRFLEDYEPDRKFDVILISNTETGPIGLHALFEGSSTLFTLEAFRAMRSRLKDDGLLVIEKGSVWDFRGHLFKSYFRGMEEAGFHVVGARPRFSALKEHPGDLGPPMGLSGFRSYIQRLASAELSRVRAFVLVGRPEKPIPLGPVALNLAEAQDFEVIRRLEDTSAHAVTDDNPFQASVLSGFFGWKQTAMGLAIAAFFSLGTAAVLIVRRRRSDALQNSRILATALLVGANFVVLENLLIYRLMRLLPNPMDAVYGGVILFVGASALGNALPRRSTGGLPELGAAAILMAACAVAFRLGFSALAVASLLPVAVITGRFFPHLLQSENRGRMLAVFALDSLGAFFGSAAAILLPQQWGLDRFTMAAAVLLWILLILWGWAVRQPAAISRVPIDSPTPH